MQDLEPKDRREKKDIRVFLVYLACLERMEYLATKENVDNLAIQASTAIQEQRVKRDSKTCRKIICYELVRVRGS